MEDFNNFEQTQNDLMEYENNHIIDDEGSINTDYNDFTGESLTEIEEATINDSINLKEITELKEEIKNCKMLLQEKENELKLISIDNQHLQENILQDKNTHKEQITLLTQQKEAHLQDYIMTKSKHIAFVVESESAQIKYKMEIKKLRVMRQEQEEYIKKLQMKSKSKFSFFN